MPPIDPDIYGRFAPQVRSVGDYENDLSRQDQSALMLQTNRLDLQGRQAAAVRQNALMDAYRAGADPSTPDGRQRLVQADPLSAPKIFQQQANLEKTRADTRLAASHAGEFDASATDKSLASARGLLPMIQNPEQMGHWIEGLYANPATSKMVTDQFGPAEAVKARIPTDPAQFQSYLQQNAMGMDKFMSMQTQMRGQDMSQQTALGTTRMNNETSRANTASNNATSIRTTGMNNATSMANNAATIGKDYKVAGLDAQGNFNGSAGPIDGLVDAIGKNQIPLSTALARVPPGMKAQAMSMLAERYPQYDETAIATRQAANKAFTTGKEGAAMRSIGTANKHLDMVGGMVEALNNKDTQLFNRIGNSVATQLGYPAPTNFDAAKEIVGQEVVKAIVAGGGGVSERAEAAAALSNAKSPAQLAGVIKTYKTIMGAQHESLLQQRDAAGLPRSTLPDYTEAKPVTTSGLPLDIAAILQKHGKK